MPLLIALLAAECAIAVVFVSAIWVLISALAFYIFVAAVAYIAWQIGRNEARRSQYLDSEAAQNRSLNDQEFAAWRDEADRGRKSLQKREEASDRLDRDRQ